MQLGSVSTLGFVIARHLYQEGLKAAVNTGELVVEDMEVEESTENVTKRELLCNSVEKIGLTFLKSLTCIVNK